MSVAHDMTFRRCDLLQFRLRRVQQRATAPRLTPAVLRYVEDNSIDVFEFLFSVDAGIVGQFHEKFPAVTFDALLGRALVFDDESKVMQSSPIRPAFATLRSLGEMQQREVHDTVR